VENAFFGCSKDMLYLWFNSFVNIVYIVVIACLEHVLRHLYIFIEKHFWQKSRMGVTLLYFLN
jgi:hypothetical protein